jgi:hypothetical protein
MGKGLYLLGASFANSYGNGRFVHLSQTKSPILKGLKFVSLTRYCCAVLMASWASWQCLCISLICCQDWVVVQPFKIAEWLVCT